MKPVNEFLFKSFLGQVPKMDDPQLRLKTLEKAYFSKANQFSKKGLVVDLNMVVAHHFSIMEVLLNHLFFFKLRVTVCARFFNHSFSKVTSCIQT